MPITWKMKQIAGIFQDLSKESKFVKIGSGIQKLLAKKQAAQLFIIWQKNVGSFAGIAAPHP